MALYEQVNHRDLITWNMNHDVLYSAIRDYNEVHVI